MTELRTPLRGQFPDLCYCAVSPTELHRSLAGLVSDLGQQMSDVNRSSVEHAHCTRSISQLFLNLQEQIYDRVTDLQSSVEQRFVMLESRLEAYHVATNLVIRNLQEQFEGEFYRNHTTGLQEHRAALEQL